MSDTHSDVDRRFAHNLFGGSDDDNERDDGNWDQHADATDKRNDGLDEQRRFAAELFAPDDPDADVLAGLTAGRTVGRTTPPQANPVPTKLDRYAADGATAPARPAIWI